MSFENKGFANSLNKKYDSLKARALNYDEPENYLPGQSPFELMAITNQFKKNNQLDTEKNKRKTRTKKVKTTKEKKEFKNTFLGGLLGVFKGDTDTESKGIVEGGGLSTNENPANLPEFVVESKKPQSNKMKYFYYIIAVILIILIYKQFKK